MRVLYIVALTNEITTVAIRILRAFSDCQSQNESDIEMLRSHRPESQSLDPEDLASIVIREFIESSRPSPEGRARNSTAVLTDVP